MRSASHCHGASPLACDSVSNRAPERSDTMKTHRSYRLLGMACVIALAACSSLLDVKNPNNVNQSDLSNPASATSQANGVQASVGRAWGQILTPYSLATDELTWIGSRDAWQSLDQGTISEPTNE